MADGSFKNIQDIKVGKKVSAFEYPFNKPGFADTKKLLRSFLG